MVTNQGRTMNVKVSASRPQILLISTAQHHNPEEHNEMYTAIKTSNLTSALRFIFDT
jgi:hypothetical protein